MFIPLDQCEHGYLYYIKARNFRLGIFNEPTKGFIGIRLKFGNRFLFEEDHWDTGAPYGTVKPTTKLEKTPFMTLACYPAGEPTAQIFDWLDLKADEYKIEEYPHIAPGHDIK